MAYKQILRQGTYAQYLALDTKDETLLYFCTDNGKLFKGSVDFTNSFVAVTAANLPAVAAAVPGKIYYVTDEHRFCTKIDGAYVSIERTLDQQGSATTSTITASSADDHVPSSKNVYTYGQEILAAAVGGTDVVKSVEAGSADAGILVTKGDSSTTSFVVPGVITEAAAGSNAAEIDLTNSTAGDSTTITVPGVVIGIADTTTDAQIAITNSTAGDSTTVTITGVVTTPTWNTTNRILTLPVSGGTAVEVNIGKDIFLESGYYDTTTEEIVLVLNDQAETEIRVPVGALIDIYTGGETSTASVSVSTTNVISTAVKLDSAAGNAITVVSGDGGGLRVDLSAYATTSELDALATAASTWGSFTD